MFGAAEADTADIAGLVYHFGYGAEPRVCLPVEGATVQLYKRTSQSGWATFGNSTTVSEDGYYIFEDVDISDGSSGIAENSD